MLAALVALAGLVHLVLVATNRADPATTTVYGVTERRAWATVVSLIALASLIAGGMARARPTTRVGAAIAAVVGGVIAAINGALVLAVATGGPGSGNGVVGGAGALVVGVAGAGLGVLAVRRRTALRRASSATA